jgi:mannose-6-phosphate isomerase-like protein (cupin superfamily)
MGMRWEIIQTSADSSGAVFESVNWLDPRMPGPPPHIHPTSEESFEVLEGSLDVFKEGAWATLRPGEAATVHSGAPHTLRNDSDEPAKIVTRIRPAGKSEDFFRHMHALIREGKLKRLPPNEPRSAIYAAMLFDRYSDEIRATGALSSVFKALALIGKGLRFKL